MKDTGRIKINTKESETSLEIFPVKDALKSKLLFVWLLVWTLCGIIVFSQFFSNLSREEKLLMAVWMAFWAYFEYKISNVYVWRKSGSEKITITTDELVYTIQVAQKSTQVNYLFENISELEVYEFGKNNFSDSFQTSYWVKGNETVFFTYFGIKKGVGFQLSKEDATKLHQAINKKLRKLK